MNHQKFKELRLAKGLTLEAIGEATGHSRGIIQRIECGKLAPSIALLKELAQIVGVKAADLLNEDE